MTQNKYLEKSQKAIDEMNSRIESKRYQDELLKMRIEGQDAKWKLLGINKEDMLKLTSAEDQKRVHEFKGGKR